METIKEVLMRRDGYSPEEAEELIESAKDALAILLDAGDLEAAENVCMDYFGLEPDYLDELI